MKLFLINLIFLFINILPCYSQDDIPIPKKVVEFLLETNEKYKVLNFEVLPTKDTIITKLKERDSLNFLIIKSKDIQLEASKEIIQLKDETITDQNNIISEGDKVIKNIKTKNIIKDIIFVVLILILI